MKSRSRRERALASIAADREAADKALASDLGELLLAAEDLSNPCTAGDVVLSVGDMELRAHRCVLGARTDYFRNAFQGEFAEARVRHIHIDGHILCDSHNTHGFVHHHRRAQTVWWR